MLFRHTLAAVTALMLLTGTASAQELCHCDCYFSFDCPEAGQGCNYGVLGNEDSCWWRTPKPQGNPGAGCTGDWGNWGECDGKCTGSGGRAFANSIESEQSVFQCLSIWSEAFNEVALRGGGYIDQRFIDQARDLRFVDDQMAYRLWRSLVEVTMLARGQQFFGFPQGEQWVPGNVAVDDLRDDPETLLNGVLATNALLAEINETGSGWEFVAQVHLNDYNRPLLMQVCRLEDGRVEDADVLDCLYDKIYRIGLVYRLVGDNHGAARGGGSETPCRGCMADCVPDDLVGLEDLLQVIGDWGSDELPAGDIDLSGLVGLEDLLAVIGGWGNCAELGTPDP